MEPYYDRAETVLTAFCEEDYGAITALFDATMQQTLGTERLAEAYEGIKKTKGAFVKEVARASEVQEDYVVVVLTCLHENGYLDLRVVFDGEKRISGLQLLESKGPKDTTPAPSRGVGKGGFLWDGGLFSKGDALLSRKRPGTGAGGGVGPWLWTM